MNIRGVQDEDEHGNLEERIPSFKLTIAHKLGKFDHPLL
jgi:hypothetical protein